MESKYSLPWTKVLSFVACRGTSKFLGVGSAYSFGGDVNTIKSGKIFAISSDVSEKHIILYSSECIESARIEQNNSDKALMIIFQVTLGMKMILLLINS